jgi:hypothetical protein
VSAHPNSTATNRAVYLGSVKLSRRLSAQHFNTLDDDNDSSSNRQKRTAVHPQKRRWSLHAVQTNLKTAAATVAKTAVDTAVTVAHTPVFMPESRSRIAWDSVSLLAVLYIAVTVPFRVAFGSWNGSQGGAQGWTHGDFVLTDALCDVFFMVDVLVRASFFPVVTGRGEQQYCAV